MLGDVGEDLVSICSVLQLRGDNVLQGIFIIFWGYKFTEDSTKVKTHKVMYFLLTNSHCCTPTCPGLLMAINCSLREQQEAGQTPAELHPSDSSYSMLVTSLIQ